MTEVFWWLILDVPKQRNSEVLVPEPNTRSLTDKDLLPAYQFCLIKEASLQISAWILFKVLFLHSGNYFSCSIKVMSIMAQRWKFYRYRPSAAPIDFELCGGLHRTFEEAPFFSCSGLVELLTIFDFVTRLLCCPLALSVPASALRVPRGIPPAIALPSPSTDSAALR